MNKNVFKDNKLVNAIQNSKIWTKLKSIKHIEIIIAVIFIAILILIYYSSFNSSNNAKKTNDTKISSSIDYSSNIENRIKNLLKNIKGAGDVDVMVTLDGSSQKIIAYDTEEKNNTVTTNTSSTSNITTTKDAIIISKDGTTTPLILQEIMPEILGVVVVAQGAGDVRVKLDIINAVTVLLNISPQNVQVFLGN